MKSVKEVLKRDKLPREYPPSRRDVTTREKHVPESVHYNMKHFSDHVENVCQQLKKLQMVNPAQAKREAKAACSVVEKGLKELKGYC